MIPILGIDASQISGHLQIRAAYFAGGYDGSNEISGIDKITFSGDTKSTLSATLSTASYILAGAANSGTAA